MKKELLLSALLLGFSATSNASGLYFSAGYGNSDPDINFNTTTCTPENPGCYPDFPANIPGWPSGTNGNDGVWAKAWAAGLPEEWVFKPEKTSIYSVAIGWDIPKNPLRFEAEYIKTTSKATYWDMIISDPSGEYCTDAAGTAGCVSNGGEYIFDLQYDTNEIRDFDMQSYMLNLYFEIPGFGNVDPYIGYGYGYSKLDTTSNGDKGGTDNETSQQLIAGIEYRIPDTAFIVGVEYRKFKMDKAPERDDNAATFDYKHDYVMFKLRYDPISDIF